MSPGDDDEEEEESVSEWELDRMKEKVIIYTVFIINLNLISLLGTISRL